VGLARVKLAETQVFFIRPEKPQMAYAIGQENLAESPPPLAGIAYEFYRTADAPPTGVPDKSENKYGYGYCGQRVHYPGELNIPENLAGGFNHDCYLFPEKVILSATIIS
jgi:hypothetical protein